MQGPCKDSPGQAIRESVHSLPPSLFLGGKAGGRAEDCGILGILHSRGTCTAIQARLRGGTLSS